MGYAQLFVMILALLLAACDGGERKFVIDDTDITETNDIITDTEDTQDTDIDDIVDTYIAPGDRVPADTGDLVAGGFIAGIQARIERSGSVEVDSGESGVLALEVGVKLTPYADDVTVPATRLSFVEFAVALDVDGDGQFGAEGDEGVDAIDVVASLRVGKDPVQFAPSGSTVSTNVVLTVDPTGTWTKIPVTVTLRESAPPGVRLALSLKRVELASLNGVFDAATEVLAGLNMGQSPRYWVEIRED